jgi:membrane associated rhomboid family serine protease
MGYQDREYYQEDRSPGGYQLGGDLSYTWRIVILNAGVFLANFFLFAGQEKDLAYYCSVHGDTLVKPYLWFQFLTYGFAHNPQGLSHIFWNMFGLVCFGSAVEEIYGRREYLRFYLIAILWGGIFWGTRVFFADLVHLDMLAPSVRLHATMMLGASGAVTAVVLLFCLRNPFATVNLMFVLPVPAWVLGTILIVGNVLQAGQTGEARVAQAIGTVAYDVHLAGAAFAVAYFYFQWNLTRIFDFTWLSRAGTSLGKLVKPRAPLKVYDGEEDDEVAYEELETEADRILAKIASEGEGTLSKKERQTLEHYSRLMRQKHR